MSKFEEAKRAYKYYISCEISPSDSAKDILVEYRDSLSIDELMYFKFLAA